MSHQLHLNHGPIDLIISCDGPPATCKQAYGAAAARFEGLLDELVTELAQLRTPLSSDSQPPNGPVARRMFAATLPLSQTVMVTPMAAVAGAVADEVGAAMAETGALDRWMVNNGGDIAFGLAPGQRYVTGLVVDPRRAEISSTFRLDAGMGVGGVATSGRHGRSLSLGIADAVTVLAPTAAAADVAATLIANHVDIGPSQAVTRQPANTLDPDSDLGATMVTVNVGPLTTTQTQAALNAGLDYAESCVDRGLISAAVLHLDGHRATTTTNPFSHDAPQV